MHVGVWIGIAFMTIVKPWAVKGTPLSSWLGMIVILCKMHLLWLVQPAWQHVMTTFYVCGFARHCTGICARNFDKPANASWGLCSSPSYQPWVVWGTPNAIRTRDGSTICMDPGYTTQIFTWTFKTEDYDIKIKLHLLKRVVCVLFMTHIVALTLNTRRHTHTTSHETHWRIVICLFSILPRRKK